MPKSVSKDVAIKADDARVLGQEPTWEAGKSYSDAERSSAMNWYAYVLSEDQRLEYVLSYFTDADEKRAIKTLKHGEIPTSAAALFRMQQRGLVLDDDSHARYVARMADLLKIGQARLVEAQTIVVAAPKTDPADKLIADIEDQFDILYRSGYKHAVDFYKWLSDNSVKSVSALKIADYYRPLAEEIALLKAGRDAELKEAYSHLTKVQIGRYAEFTATLVADCERWATQAKKAPTRKPRKKKIVPADKLVAKVKFQKENTDLKLVSIDPVRIIGASEIWLYNTRYNILQRYFAADQSGFGMKGTTLQNYKVETSTYKKIRKPETVKDLTESTQKRFAKDFTALKTKDWPCNGRINENTLILRAFK